MVSKFTHLGKLILALGEILALWLAFSQDIGTMTHAALAARIILRTLLVALLGLSLMGIGYIITALEMDHYHLKEAARSADNIAEQARNTHMRSK